MEYSKFQIRSACESGIQRCPSSWTPLDGPAPSDDSGFCGPVTATSSSPLPRSMRDFTVQLSWRFSWPVVETSQFFNHARLSSDTAVKTHLNWWRSWSLKGTAMNHEWPVGCSIFFSDPQNLAPVFCGRSFEGPTDEFDSFPPIGSLSTLLTTPNPCVQYKNNICSLTVLLSSCIYIRNYTYAACITKKYLCNCP